MSGFYNCRNWNSRTRISSNFSRKQKSDWWKLKMNLKSWGTSTQRLIHLSLKSKTNITLWRKNTNCCRKDVRFMKKNIWKRWRSTIVKLWIRRWSIKRWILDEVRRRRWGLFGGVPYSEMARIRSMIWKVLLIHLLVIVVLKWVDSQTCLQPLSLTRMSLLKISTLAEAKEASLMSWEQTISKWR